VYTFLNITVYLQSTKWFSCPVLKLQALNAYSHLALHVYCNLKINT